MTRFLGSHSGFLVTLPGWMHALAIWRGKAKHPLVLLRMCFSFKSRYLKKLSGLKRRSGANGGQFLTKTSAKMTQFSWRRVPVLVPHIFQLHCDHFVFFFQPGFRFAFGTRPVQLLAAFFIVKPTFCCEHIPLFLVVLLEDGGWIFICTPNVCRFVMK